MEKLLFERFFKSDLSLAIDEADINWTNYNKY